MNLASWLEKSAKNTPGAIAIYDGLEKYASYKELLQKVLNLSQGLTNLGIKKSDKVAIWTKNCPEYLEILYAIWWIGAVCVPINFKLHSSEVEWILENSNTSLLFSDKEIKSFSKKENIIIGTQEWNNLFLNSNEYLELKELEDDDLAWIFYTSGTTGRPKGTMLTHKNIMATAYGYCFDVDIPNSKYNMLYAAPMSHGAGLYNHIFIRIGASHIIPKSRGFNEKEIHSLAKEHTNIVMFAAPTMVKRLISYAKVSHWYGKGIKTIIYGGGPMYLADINQALKQFGNKFVQIYGQGETPMTISCLTREQLSDKSHKNWEKRRSSVGQALAGVEAKIVDENFNKLKANEIGEVVVKGNTVMSGYLNNEEATKNALINGWLKTGDLGYFDEDDFLYLTGRSKDVIISGGSNIYPIEVEETLLKHPNIKEASVIGKKDDEWGEIVVAFIVLYKNKNLQVEQLNQWCKENMASFKKPKIYKFLDDLPKNSYGKILKTKLREKI